MLIHRALVDRYVLVRFAIRKPHPSADGVNKGSVLTFETKSIYHRRRRLETCVHEPISKRWAIHFKLIVGGPTHIGTILFPTISLNCETSALEFAPDRVTMRE
jgi:hypothetical protein